MDDVQSTDQGLSKLRGLQEYKLCTCSGDGKCLLGPYPLWRARDPQTRI